MLLMLCTQCIQLGIYEFKRVYFAEHKYYCSLHLNASPLSSIKSRMGETYSTIPPLPEEVTGIVLPTLRFFTIEIFRFLLSFKKKLNKRLFESLK
jgi:hypothetical protein